MTTEVQAFIEAEKQADRNVNKACELLVVSRSAFYDRLDYTPVAPRILDELREEGFLVGKKRVARLMIQAGLAGRCRRRSGGPSSPILKKGPQPAGPELRPGETHARHHLGRRRHLCAHLGRLGLFGHGDRPGLVAHRRLGQWGTGHLQRLTPSRTFNHKLRRSILTIRDTPFPVSKRAA